jgi:hypothetical protein
MARKYIRLSTALGCTVVLASCEQQPPEIKLARDAGEACGIDSARVCVSALKTPGDYVMGLYGDREPRKLEDLKCLEVWAKEQKLRFQSSSVGRCRTAHELNISRLAEKTCGLEHGSVVADTMQSWVNVYSVDRNVSDQKLNCLGEWTKNKGLSFVRRPFSH